MVLLCEVPYSSCYGRGMLRASLANAARTPHCVAIVAEVVGLRETKIQISAILFGRHYCKGHLRKARQQKRWNESAVVNKMSGLNLDLFCNGYFVSSVSILLREAVIQASIGELRQHFAGLCETVQGFHVSNRWKFHEAPSSYLHRKWYAYHQMFSASVSLKMRLRCFRKPFSRLHLDPFSVLRALGNLRPTCTDCYPLTFNVGVRNTSLLTDAFIHRSSMCVHFNLKSHARLTSGLHNFPMQGAMHYHNRSQQRQQSNLLYRSEFMR